MADNKNATQMLAADAAGIARAAAILERGGLVAVPTETVYGLAVRADSADAVARIYAAKGRPDFNPLIVHVCDWEQARRYAEPRDAGHALAASYWPGPLTLVLPLKANAGLAPAVTAGLPSIAVRAPAHPLMRRLLGEIDFPLAAPSANSSGFLSPTTAEHVLTTLDGRIDAVVDGGACEAGVESTIVAVRDDGSLEELRSGPIDIAYIHSVVSSAEPAISRIEAPGQLVSHYSPGKPVRLAAKNAQADEFHIGFGRVAGDCTLSTDGDINEAAARLYDCLHQGAASEKPRLAIAPVPNFGVGRAINDRLNRAAM